MKLKVLDQIHVSSVSSDSLQPRQEIEVSDELGKELLNRHPATFHRIREPKKKAQQTPPNKAAQDPENKSA